MNFIQKFILLFFIPSVLFCQAGTREANFIKSLINGSSTDSYIQPSELEISKRLGISYKDVPQKYFIAYDIDNNIKAAIKNGEMKYELSSERTGDHSSVLTFNVPAAGYRQSFYFIESFVVSPAKYYSQKWQHKESKYFRFYISNPALFNDYAVSRLDEFVTRAETLLGYTKEEAEELQKNKIYYFLCNDDAEIEKLTGYKSKGNYILSCDYIITTYNCHFHEIVHLLMNNKLKSLPLFTHPFLQEGLAVAAGGRGGYEPGVMMQLGAFEQKSGYADYKEYLSFNDFRNNDASFTYPLSGLYNMFLLRDFGFEKYEQLYRKYSGSIDELSASVIDPALLPSADKWIAFVSEYSAAAITPGITANNAEVIYNNDSLIIAKDKTNLYVKSKGNIIISGSTNIHGYTSKLFKEEVPGKMYNGEKYFIKVSKSEVSLYNLYTNNLIANYAMGFSSDMKPVPENDGYYLFTLPVNLFREETSGLTYKIL
jgi:hypothetical protein